MELSLDVLLGLVAALILLILYCIGLLLYYKYRLSKRRRYRLQLTRLLLADLSAPLSNAEQLQQLVKKSPKRAFQLLIDFGQTHKLQQDSRWRLMELVRDAGLDVYYQKRLTAKTARKRIDAAVHLVALPGEMTNRALELALQNESLLAVKLQLCATLTSLGNSRAIPLMIDTLPGAPQWYRTRVNMMLASFGKDLHDELPNLLSRDETEIHSLLIDFASIYPSQQLKDYLLQQTNSPLRDLAYRATRTIGLYYYHELNKPEFLFHPDPVLRNIVIEALEKIPSRQTIETLLPLLADPRSSDTAVVVISQILQKQPQHLAWIIEVFSRATTNQLRNALAKILSNRIDYLLMQLIVGKNERLRPILTEMIRLGKTNGILGFLNKNRTIEAENSLLELLRPLLTELPDLRTELRLYLPPRILAKLNETPLEHPPSVRDHSSEKGKLLRLRLLLPIVLGIVPLYYMVRYWNYLSDWSLFQHLTRYVLDFNYFIAWYSLSVNSSYLILLVLSFVALNKQARNWRLKKTAFLFRPRILPSISIIAPAYQEEASILESANSLLSLHYPNYEVIIVNDGSTDQTLQKLIAYFRLEKVDRFVPARLNTRPIRGIYANPSYPKLIVVDKAGGGKADALNVGINVSRKEFVCGIDSDSLLEKDSLIKMASMILDAPYEPVALGGNIFPVNGCTVEKGTLTKIDIPRSHIARFQTIEYIRAFMAGRLGWSQLRSLLIISGAFGLFGKDRVVEIGGYLTSSERFKKDTVGEDMELVVRLNRHMLENRIPFSVLYSFNATCWTEVPESLNILHRQRDRWQRGLIDILYFHRTMQFNPRYGRIGMLAMPYFFVFELFGPFIEMQGYLMVLIAWFLGLLNLEIVLLLFVTSVLLGILVSMFALTIAEKESDAFPGPYILTMMGYALLENFGPRQLISFWRVAGYFSSLRQTAAWGKMTRQGFQQPNSPASGQ